MRSGESAYLRDLPPIFPQGSDPNISPKFSGCASNPNAREIIITTELQYCYPDTKFIPLSNHGVAIHLKTESFLPNFCSAVFCFLSSLQRVVARIFGCG